MRQARVFLTFLLALLLANVPALQVSAPHAWIPSTYSKAQAVDVDLQFLKGYQFLDSNGDPLSGGKLYFYDAGTTSDRTVYSDEDGSVAQSQPVTLDSAGRLTTSVYIPVGSWKFTLTDADDVTVFTEDNIEGAFDTSTLASSYGRPTTPVLSKATNYTVTSDDYGKTIACDATGGNVQITLPSAITVGNGSSQSNWIIIQNVGSSGTCTATAVGGQNINGSTNYQLTSQFDQIFLISDGANWRGLTQDVADGSVTTAKLDSSVLGQFVKVGSVVAWPGTSCPTGYLSPFGQAVSRTTYATLFDEYGTTYGSGDGSTTFNLPDMRGRVVAGLDNMGGTSANRLTDSTTQGLNGDTLGDTGGEEAHTQTSSELVSHTHGVGTYQSAGHLHGAGTLGGSATTVGSAHSHAVNDQYSTLDTVSSGTGATSVWRGIAGTGSTTSSGAHTHELNITGSTATDGPRSILGTSASAGSGSAFNVLQPTIVLNWCVFASAEIASGGSGALHTILSGSGAPGAGLGSDGDFYIDTDAYAIYGPKAAGSWGSGTSLVAAGLADPDDDRIQFWDDSEGAVDWLDLPAAGLSISGTSLALANDLAGVEGLSGTGIAARTASDTWATRTLTGTTNEICVSDGAGTSGNPTFSLCATVDLTGKTVTAGTASISTLNGVGTIDATTESTIEGAIDTLTLTGFTLNAAISGTGVGIDNGDILTAKNTAADDEFARFTADGVEGLSEAEFKAAANLEIGTDVQAYDAQLADIAGLGITKGNLLAADGANWDDLAVGTDGQCLLADSGAALGVAWGACPGAGSGAPTDAQYLTLATNASLSDERVLTAGAGVSVTDGGAGGAATVANTAIPGYIYGLTLANNSTDATNDIDVAVGRATADDDSAVMVLGSSITKRLDAAWAVGTGNGGLDTGSIANTTYFVWLIRRSDTGVVDVLFSTSPTSPTMPTNYDQKRRVGAILRESGSIVQFVQFGDTYLRKTVVANAADNNPGTSAVLSPLSVPIGIEVEAIFGFSFADTSGTTAFNRALVTSPLQNDVSPAAGSSLYNALIAGEGTRAAMAQQFKVWTNTSGQIRYRLETSNASITVRTITVGWRDPA